MKFYVDLNQTNKVVTTRKLLHYKGLSPRQRLFLIEIIDYLSQGNRPYLSQSEFAEHHEISRMAVYKMIKALEKRGIIENLGQVEEGLACEFYVLPKFLAEIGYTDTPVKYTGSEAIEEDAPQAAIVSNLSAPVTAPVKQINYNLVNVNGERYGTFRGYLQAFQKQYPNEHVNHAELEQIYNNLDNPF